MRSSFPKKWKSCFWVILQKASSGRMQDVCTTYAGRVWVVSRPFLVALSLDLAMFEQWNNHSATKSVPSPAHCMIGTPPWEPWHPLTHLPHAFSGAETGRK